MLIRIPEPDKREFYELESARSGWSGKETERQINAALYERLVLSSDKESVLAVARRERLPERPGEIIKADDAGVPRPQTAGGLLRA